MAELLQFVFSGLTVGAIYALVALGFTLIYKASDIINFAQGEFVMLGGMLTVFVAHAVIPLPFVAHAGIPLPLAAVIAIVATTAIGLALHRFAIEPARGATPVALIMITIGASIFLRGTAQIVFDRRFHSLPPLLGADPIQFGGAAILPQSLVVLATAAVIVVALWLFIDRTIFGKAVIATAANRLAARLVGVDTRRIVAFSFGVSAAIGAIAGVLITPIALTSYDAGTLLALKGFAAAMLGGIGSAPGAVVGGILIGMCEALAAGYLSSNYKDAVAFLIILVVLVAIPQGLFGRAKIERV
jgi:branched-chain amino acid transport system permease protein